MASWRRHDSNIDPFNAGEPVMPWDDPGAQADLPDEDAEERGRIKEPDAYDAPSPIEDEPEGDLGQRAKPAAGSSGPSRPRRPRRDAPRTVQAKRAAQASKPAEKKSSFGCLLRAIAIVFLITTGLQMLSSCATSFMITWPSDDSSREEPAFEETLEPEDPSVPELAISGVVSHRLDDLFDGDAELAERIRESLDEDIEQFIHLTPNELGIDTGDIATWILQHVTYTPSSAYADEQNGTANAYFYVYAPRAFDIASAITAETRAYLQDQGLALSHDLKLTDEQRAELAGRVGRALEDVESDRSYYAAFKLTQDAETGMWSLDESSFSEQMRFALGL